MKKGLLFLVFILQAQSAFALSAAGQALKAQLLALSDQQLYDKALERHSYNGGPAIWSGVGACNLGDAHACTQCACDYYSTTNYPNPTGYSGLPYSETVPGTGCLVWKGAGTGPQSTPICWNGWSGQGVCGSTVLSTTAKQMRAALNSPLNGGDVCKLDQWLSLQTPPKGGMLSELGETKLQYIVSGNVTSMGSEGFDPANCRMNVTISGVPALKKVSAKICKNFARIFRQKHAGQSGALPPVISAANAVLQIAIGNLSSQQIAAVSAQAYQMLNGPVLGAIDANFKIVESGKLADGSTASAAQISAAQANIVQLNTKLQQPTQEYVGQALIASVDPSQGAVYAPSSTAANLNVNQFSIQNQTVQMQAAE